MNFFRSILRFAALVIFLFSVSTTHIPLVSADPYNPQVFFTNNVSSTPTNSDTITIQTDEPTTIYAFQSWYSLASDCSGFVGSDYVADYPFDISGIYQFTINTATYNNYYLCFNFYSIFDVPIPTLISANPLNIDLTPPTSNFAGLSTSNPNPDITGTTSLDTATVNFLINSLDYGYVATVNNGTFTVDGNVFPPIPPGTYTVDLVTIDHVGNTNIQTFPDSLTIQSPAIQILVTDGVSSNPVQTDTITVQTDQAVLPGSFQYWFSETDSCIIGINPPTVLQEANATTGISFIIDTEDFNDQYLCFSAQNILADPATILVLDTTIHIDQTPPYLTVILPTNTLPAQSIQFDLALHYFDSEPNLDESTLRYGFVSDSDTCNNGDATLPFSYTPTSTEIVVDSESYNGQYLCLQAGDTAGNMDWFFIDQAIYIDTTSPLLNLQTIWFNASQNSEFTGTTDEELQSITGYYPETDQNFPVTLASNSIDWRFDNSNPAFIPNVDGEAVIELTATDLAGNQSTQSFTIYDFPDDLDSDEDGVSDDVEMQNGLDRNDNDSDNDGFDDGSEFYGPNNGDGNNDDVLDALQNSIQMVHLGNDVYITIDSPCELLEAELLQNPNMNTESLVVEFPFGSISLVFSCQTPTITIWWSDIDESKEYQLVNLESYSQLVIENLMSLTSFTEVTYQTVSINGVPTLVTSLQLTDASASFALTTSAVIPQQNQSTPPNSASTIQTSGTSESINQVSLTGETLRTGGMTFVEFLPVLALILLSIIPLAHVKSWVK